MMAYEQWIVPKRHPPEMVAGLDLATFSAAVGEGDVVDLGFFQLDFHQFSAAAGRALVRADVSAHVDARGFELGTGARSTPWTRRMPPASSPIFVECCRARWLPVTAHQQDQNHSRHESADVAKYATPPAFCASGTPTDAIADEKLQHEQRPSTMIAGISRMVMKTKIGISVITWAFGKRRM